MKYKPERDLPEFAREFKTLSPSILANYVLAKRNEEITPESVTMWFKRHPEIAEQLRKELIDGLPTNVQAVDSSVFQNGSFQEIPSVKEWITYLRAVRRIKETSINQLVGTLRQICEGKLPKKNIDFVAEGKMCLKHPDRLTYQDALQFISLIRERNVEPYQFAKTLKSFLVVKGVTEGARIMVGKHGSFGKFKELYVPAERLNAMLASIKEKHGLEPYVIDQLMYRKAFRIHAVIKAKIENLSAEGRITVFEKGLERKYGKEGKQITRTLSLMLNAMVQDVINGRPSGPIFKLTADNMADINNEAIKEFAPEVLVKYGHVNPNHFWRHMFAQHMLRKTKWNTAIVAALGNWTEQALKESYGEPPEDMIAQWTAEYATALEE